MKAQFFTDRGLVRAHNEDAGGTFYNQTDQLLAVVADGMGGHKAGNIASNMAVSIIKEKWEQNEQCQRPEQAEQWLTNTIAEVNESIYDNSSSVEAYQGMGTTAVIVISAEDFVTVAHIGDSRCYLLNENGFSQITEDHSLVNELLRTGQITKSDAGHHPRKNVVLKALGTEEMIEADIKSLSWERGNKLLLCSDGLSDKVTDDNLLVLLQLEESIETVGQKMIELANENGGEDNISLIIINYEEIGEDGDTPC